MLSVQVMANDVAVGFGGAGGYLEMNVYKPLMIHGIAQSITLLTDGCVNFRKFLVEGGRSPTARRSPNMSSAPSCSSRRWRQ